jgi:hypothetical protein
MRIICGAFLEIISATTINIELILGLIKILLKEGKYRWSGI